MEPENETKPSVEKSLELRYIELLEEKIAHLEAEAKLRKEKADSTPENNDNDDKGEEKKTKSESQPNGDPNSQKNNEKADTDEITRKKPRVRYLEREGDDFGDYIDKEVESFQVEENGEDKKKESSSSSNKEEGKGDIAISWRRSKLKKERQLLIESPDLRKALKEVMTDYPEISFDTAEVAFDPPYAPLYHIEEKLEKYIEKEDVDDATKKDVSILIEEVDSMQSKERQDANNLIKNGQIQYDLLWTLFYPGCQVCQKPMGDNIQVSILAPLTQQDPSSERYKLLIWSLDFDGTNYKYVETETHIKSFKGSKAITDLEVYPLEYWKGSQESDTVDGLKKKLIERGKKFQNLCNLKPEQRMCNYEGPVLDEGVLEMLTDGATEGDTASDRGSTVLIGPKTKEETERIETKTPVMVDHYAYTTYGGKQLKLGKTQLENDPCSCTACTRMRKENVGELPSKQPVGMKSKKVELNENQLLICPPRVCGFVVQSKRWVQMLVNNVQEIQQTDKEKAFEKLELPRKTKELLKSLVMEHSKGNMLIDDLIPGKGAGLIVLLHGPPGVGKTLTAESLAMLTGKPLYNVNISDIGSKADVVEQNFNTIFQVATHWSALLLFDEADVFLERRSLQDMQRNSLVSVLLRILEYFQGILFLTSNRVKTFDEAFQSRIHLAVQYKKLESRQRTRIWETWLKRGRDYIQDYDQMLQETGDDGELQKAELNGRQIRNVFRSALALARADEKNTDPDKKMSWDHLKQVLDASTSFQAYMTQTEEAAQREGLR